MRNKRLLQNIFLVVISLLTGLAIVEITLGYIFPERYYIWPPGLDEQFFPDPSVMPGVSFKSNFITNREGFRNSEDISEDDFLILALGGSTTECLYLDQDETWTALLEKSLRAKYPQKKIKVLNGGRSGLNSSHHLLQTEKLLKQHPNIGLIIIMQGINDLQRHLASGEKISQDKLLSGAFYSFPPKENLSPLKKTNIYRLIRQFFRQPGKKYLSQDRTGSSYSPWRANRGNAKITDEIPQDFPQNLNKYASNTRGMIKAAKESNVNILFLTQPVLWNSGMSDFEKILCWFGWKGENQVKSSVYYSFETLEKMMDNYNRILTETCVANGATVFDLAGRLPKDTSVFYDDCHFNKPGAEKVAAEIFNYLISAELLK